jgi:hypothetical protein
MTKLYVYSWDFHRKNVEGLILICGYAKILLVNSIEEADIIYSPLHPLEANNYPNKKFIFGPQFSIFPDYNFYMLNNQHKNITYIQPSEWACNVWVDILKNKNFQNNIPILPTPFPVDIFKFNETNNNSKKTKVFIYFKRRKPEELNFIKDFLSENNIQATILQYGSYNENDYLDLLHTSKFGIWIGTHESQGFALEEALSCNVPLLVWNVTSMSQEFGCPNNFFDVKTKASSIGYWDERCGEFFYSKTDFKDKYDLFISKLSTYNPRQFILENLDTMNCYEKFWKKIVE